MDGREKREERATLERNGRGTRLAGIGGLALAVFLGLSSIASGSAPALTIPLKDVSPYSFLQTDVASGCAGDHGSYPTIAFPSGHAALSLTMYGRTCTAARGGRAVVSEVYGEASIGAERSVKLTSNERYLNVSYSATYSLASSVLATIPATCPTTHQHQKLLETNGTATTVVWYNQTQSTCWATAYYALTLNQVVCVPAHYSCLGQTLPLASNITGTYWQRTVASYNYSDPAVARSANSTSNTTVSATYGPSNSTVQKQSGVLSLFGHWKAGETVEIEAYYEIRMTVEVTGVPSASAVTSLSAHGSRGYLAITGITLG